MALIDFQIGLGKAVQAANDRTPIRGLNLTRIEQACLEAIKKTPGLELTRAVQRSWCEGRATRAARLTLRALPTTERHRLLDRWLESDGGTASLFAAEANAFLTFIEQNLPERSPVRALCQLERATIRAAEGIPDFVPPPPISKDSLCALRRGHHADLVRYTDQSALIGVFPDDKDPPSVSSDAVPMLFAPGIEGLCRLATEAEEVLWQRLEAIPHLPMLLDEGHRIETINQLIAEGVTEA